MYRKKPQKSSGRQKTTATVAKIKTRNWFKLKPLTKNQLALINFGKIKKPLLLRLYEKHPKAFIILEKVFFVLIMCIGLFFNAYLLLILPVAGAAIFYKDRINFFWSLIKVYIIQKNFYQDRRELYKMGSLNEHLNVKEPRKFKNAIIWGESQSVQEKKFEKLQKSGKIKKREYIKIITP